MGKNILDYVYKLINIFKLFFVRLKYLNKNNKLFIFILKDTGYK